MQDIIIVGASGFGRELYEIIEGINRKEPTWNVLGFIDDNLNALDAYDISHKVLGTIRDWQPTDREWYALAIAAPKIKEKLVPALKAKGARFATVLDPTVTVGVRSRIGEGVVMAAQANISIDVTVGDYVFLNTNAGIGHDSTIGDYCTFGPKACMSGHTTLGRCVNVGALASTHPGVEVGDYATIGMNSCVIRKVRAGKTVIGVPAKTMDF